MSTLQGRLDRLRASFTAQAPPAALAVMHAATEALRASGILNRVPQVGDPLPAFALPDTAGAVVRSGELLERGPLVVTVYRGEW